MWQYNLFRGKSMKSIIIRDQAELHAVKSSIEKIYVNGEYAELDLILEEKMLPEVNRFFDHMIRVNGFSKTFFRFEFLTIEQKVNHDRKP